MSDLRQWQNAGLINSVDVQLATVLGRLSSESSAEVLIAAALASQWIQRGHVCLDLKTLGGQDLRDWVELPWLESGYVLPEFEHWLHCLQASKLVGNGDAPMPLVLWKDRYLYLYRYWEYEQEAVTRLEELNVAQPISEAAPEVICAQIQKLFNKEGSTLQEDDQMLAVARAMEHRFLTLTGGPGTGKTTTVLRLMALILLHSPNIRIALAAPTGKAAMRLEESILKGKSELPVNDALRAAIPASAQTLHRLLGYQKGKTSFQYNEINHLPYDLIIIDEASMIDLAIGAKLLKAIGPTARLIFVGDRDQLPSVEAGALFSDLASDVSPLMRVELRKNYRFSTSSGIGALALAIQSGDADRLKGTFSEADPAELMRRDLPPLSDLRKLVWEKVKEYQKGLLLEGEAIGEVFDRMESFRILCAHRVGPYGAEAINGMVESLLIDHHLIEATAKWYSGRPILITENDYSSGLFNGDIGVVLPWKGKLQVVFRSGQESFRFVSPARLPAHESAYAMTVHKSQGSEFDEVLLILSDQPSRLMTRELLYTGVTRARKRVEIWGAEDLVELCIQAPLLRMTGIKERWRE